MKSLRAIAAAVRRKRKMKSLRAIVVAVVITGLVLATGGAVFAQEPELIETEGVIKTVNTHASTITITPGKGKAVVLAVGEDTEIYRDENTASIEDLVKGDEVEALYTETLEAVKIVAKSPEASKKGGKSGGSPGHGKRGLVGTVQSTVTVTANVTYEISLETKQGTYVVTANATAKYMVPRETKGSKGLATFLGIVDENENSDLDELVGRRLAVLVTLTDEFAGNAIRLMLIPSPDAPPLYAHRVGVVQAFSPGSTITIIDRHGVSHNFDMNGTTYRPEGTTAGDIKTSEPWSFVTVVTEGDPKLNPVAKAIVLHKELPNRWPLP